MLHPLSPCQLRANGGQLAQELGHLLNGDLLTDGHEVRPEGVQGAERVALRGFTSLEGMAETNHRISVV
jgi:hypothetical protein